MTHDLFLAMKWEEIEGSDTVFKTIKKEPEGPFFRLILLVSWLYIPNRIMFYQLSSQIL